MKQIGESELILNSDGSIFHLHLKPNEISDTIILVGDPGRVDTVSDYFDKIEVKAANREFVTHTGTYKGKRITVTSTGIGTDNCDIVINELDALVNIDLEKRVIKEKHTKLNFIRIGTSGALQPDMPVDSYIITKKAIGFDGLLNFYADRDKFCDLEFEKAFTEYVGWNKQLAAPYTVDASEKLYNKLSEGIREGITIASPGFYGPQGRIIRLQTQDNNLNSKIENFDWHGKKITNYEMESSAIFGLGKMLGHDAVTLCAIIANRMRKEYSKDYKIVVKQLIKLVLDRITV
ncbi:MAG TPA: phosphorylase [Bacteroidales bacterium]|nr:MAG: phosphorylase [Bacteroidetes bacterium GWF2_33_38]HBF87562.1 phosphorylase [Bacteroidales bacterium]